MLQSYTRHRLKCAQVDKEGRRTTGWRLPPCRMDSASKQKQGDVPAGTNGSGAPPGESAPWAPSTGTCSLRTSAPASRHPSRRRTDVPEYRPAAPARASGIAHEIARHGENEVGVGAVHLRHIFLHHLDSDVGPAFDQSGPQPFMLASYITVASPVENPTGCATRPRPRDPAPASTDSR